MWKKGQKRKGESGGGSDGEDAPASKRTFRKDGDGEDEHVVCQLSKNRRVTVRTFGGKIVVDIREFYVKDGKELPGKKGISLTMDQWNVLREHIAAIDEAVSANS